MSLGRVAEARTLVERILAETADMGEQWVRGHFLDTLGMVLLVAGEVDKAQATLREALALPGRADPHSRAEIEAHLALALLVQGKIELAEQVMAHGVPTGFGAEIELQFHFLGLRWRSPEATRRRCGTPPRRWPSVWKQPATPSTPQSPRPWLPLRTIRRRSQPSLRCCCWSGSPLFGGQSLDAVGGKASQVQQDPGQVRPGSIPEDELHDPRAAAHDTGPVGEQEGLVTGIGRRQLPPTRCPRSLPMTAPATR
jgi:hypothetical protein